MVPSPSELSPLSLHDALPIWRGALRTVRGGRHLGVPRQRGGGALRLRRRDAADRGGRGVPSGDVGRRRDRKSTRLNSSHVAISYAVFCLTKKRDYCYASHVSR